MGFLYLLSTVLQSVFVAGEGASFMENETLIVPGAPRKSECSIVPEIPLSGYYPEQGAYFPRNGGSGAFPSDGTLPYMGTERGSNQGIPRPDLGTGDQTRPRWTPSRELEFNRTVPNNGVPGAGRPEHGKMLECERGRPEYGAMLEHGREAPEYGRGAQEHGGRPRYGREPPEYGQRAPGYGGEAPEYGRTKPEVCIGSSIAGPGTRDGLRGGSSSFQRPGQESGVPSQGAIPSIGVPSQGAIPSIGGPSQGAIPSIGVPSQGAIPSIGGPNLLDLPNTLEESFTKKIAGILKDGDEVVISGLCPRSKSDDTGFSFLQKPGSDLDYDLGQGGSPNSGDHSGKPNFDLGFDGRPRTTDLKENGRSSAKGSDCSTAPSVESLQKIEKDMGKSIKKKMKKMQKKLLRKISANGKGKKGLRAPDGKIKERYISSGGEELAPRTEGHEGACAETKKLIQKIDKQLNKISSADSLPGKENCK